MLVIYRLFIPQFSFNCDCNYCNQTCITLHRKLSINYMFCGTTPLTESIYRLHVIRNTAHRPNTQASYPAARVQPNTENQTSGANCSHTQTHHNIISLLASDVFNVIIRTTTSYPGQWVQEVRDLQTEIFYIDRVIHKINTVDIAPQLAIKEKNLRNDNFLLTLIGQNDVRHLSENLCQQLRHDHLA